GSGQPSCDLRHRLARAAALHHRDRRIPDGQPPCPRQDCICTVCLRLPRFPGRAGIPERITEFNAAAAGRFVTNDGREVHGTSDPFSTVCIWEDVLISRADRPPSARGKMPLALVSLYWMLFCASTDIIHRERTCDRWCHSK